MRTFKQINEILLIYGWAVFALIIVIAVFLHFSPLTQEPSFEFYEYYCYGNDNNSYCSQRPINQFNYTIHINKENMSLEWLKSNCRPILVNKRYQCQEFFVEVK